MINIIKSKNENNEYFKKDDKNDTSFYYHFNEITSSLKSFFEINLIKKEYKEKKIEFEKIITKNLVTENEILLKQLVEFIKTFFEIFREEAFGECVKDFFKNFTFILTSEDEAIFAVGKDALNEMFKNKGSLKKDERIKGLILQFLTNLEKKDLDFVAKRTDEFIKLLTEKINIQTVYKSFAEELKQIKNSELVIKIINIINNQLLESNNAEMIKYQINKADKKRSNFFEILFKTWSMNSISCLLLCLIAEDFELSYELLKNFGKINLTLDDLGEYSQIIQIFESKKFTSKYKIFNSCFIYRYKIILN
jgi:vacuole morphology and inheritance protein 14